VNFEVAEARLAFHSHRTYAGLRMAVRGQDRARRHAPLNDGERHAAKAGAEFDLGVETGECAKLGIGRGFQAHGPSGDAVQIGILADLGGVGGAQADEIVPIERRKVGRDSSPARVLQDPLLTA
jgi:hypothetical protein